MLKMSNTRIERKEYRKRRVQSALRDMFVSNEFSSSSTDSVFVRIIRTDVFLTRLVRKLVRDLSTS